MKGSGRFIPGKVIFAEKGGEKGIQWEKGRPADARKIGGEDGEGVSLPDPCLGGQYLFHRRLELNKAERRNEEKKVRRIWAVTPVEDSVSN